MSKKLDRLTDVIYLGEAEITVVEQPHKKTKQFMSMVTGLAKDGFKQIANDISVVDFAAQVLTEKPFEALQLFVPELTQEQFDEATNRELKQAFTTVLKVNGVDLEALGKNIKPLLKQGLKTVAEQAQK
jgi:hypothetical protein